MIKSQPVLSRKIFISDFFLGLTSALLGSLSALWYWGFSFSNFLTLIRVPFFGDGDEILYMVNARSFMTNGKLTNSIYSFPSFQDLNFAYFSVDSFATLFAGVFSKIFNDLIVGVNVYYLFIFALTSALSYCACRILSISKLVSLISSLAMNLLPMHLTGGTQSLTLGTIALIPIVSAICLRQIGGNPILDLTSLVKGKRSQKIKQWSLVALLLIYGASYSYYAAMIVFIFGSLYLFKVFSGEIKNRIALPFALMNVSVGFLLASIPALITAHTESGQKYLEARSWTASLHLTGYPGQFFLPYTNTLVDRISTSLFDWYPLKSASLRILSTQGYFAEGEIYTMSFFIVIPAAVVFFLSRRNLSFGGRDKDPEIYLTLSTIYQATFFTFLWSIIGGLGVIFSLFISPILRGYSRFMVLAPILLVLAIGIYISNQSALGFTSSLKKTPKLVRRDPKMFLIFLSVSVALSCIDSLSVAVGRDRALRPPSAISQRDSMYKLYDALLLGDQKAGCGVLQMPIVHYPYEQPGYPLYRLLVPGLYGDKFRWSSGATQGSKGWEYLAKYREMQDNLDPSLMEKALKSDFCAVLIDKTAWDFSFSFVPYAEYKPVPPVSFNAYLEKILKNKNILVTQITTEYGDYIAITLKK